MPTFKVRASRTRNTVTITSVPKEYEKTLKKGGGFVKRLPAALAVRTLDYVEDGMGIELHPGSNTISIEPSRNGKYIVSSISKGFRDEEEVKHFGSILINRDTGVGISLCFLKDLQGKRVSVEVV